MGVADNHHVATPLGRAERPNDVDGLLGPVCLGVGDAEVSMPCVVTMPPSRVRSGDAIHAKTSIAEFRVTDRGLTARSC